MNGVWNLAKTIASTVRTSVGEAIVSTIKNALSEEHSHDSRAKMRTFVVHELRVAVGVGILHGISAAWADSPAQAERRAA